MLAIDTPAALIKARNAANLEAAFISYLEEAMGVQALDLTPVTRTPREGHGRDVQIGTAPPRAFAPSWFSLRRLFATAVREALELARDPIRLGFALFGTVLLMLVFGFGISTDVNNLSFAVLDRDQSPESRAYLEELRGSTYFVERAPLADYADLDKRLESGDIKTAIEIPPNFGRDIKRGRPVWVGAWVDGSMPFRADVRFLQVAMSTFPEEVNRDGGDDQAALFERSQILDTSARNMFDDPPSLSQWEALGNLGEDWYDLMQLIADNRVQAQIMLRSEHAILAEVSARIRLLDKSGPAGIRQVGAGECCDPGIAAERDVHPGNA